jgi:hypothetical protein
MPIHSRNAHSKGVSGSTSTSCDFPLMVSVAILYLLDRSGDESDCCRRQSRITNGLTAGGSIPV